MQTTKWRIACAFVAVIVIGLGVNACNKAEARNLVDGIAPASTAFAGIHGFAEELAKLPAVERASYLDRARPRLNEGVVFFLRSLGRIKEDEVVEKVELFFGSIENTTASDGQGREHKGYFKDELVARVTLKGGRTEDALVRCLNLWLELPRHLRNLQRLSSIQMLELTQFTIGRGEGLIHYVDYAVAMTLAEKHNLPLYRGKVQQARFRITPDQARRLESRTDWEQITVGVYPGDSFNLRDGTLTRR